MKKILKFLISKVFLFNVLAVILFCIIAFQALTYFLNSYTRHGETHAVPNFIGLQIDEVEQMCSEKGFYYVVTDSVYSDFFDKGAVVEQHPFPDVHVKEGRTIYLITNSFEDEMIEMPQFVGYTVRQATSWAESYGLRIGELKYFPDIAVNVVINQYYQGEEIKPGERVPRGASIDLMVGLGISDRRTMAPNLVGKTRQEASQELLNAYLNLGAVRYDTTVVNKIDSAKALVYKQSPRRSTINLINLGYNIDIWLTTDTALVDIEKGFAPDYAPEEDTLKVSTIDLELDLDQID